MLFPSTLTLLGAQAVFSAAAAAAAAPGEAKAFVTTSDLKYKLSSVDPPTKGAGKGGKSEWNLTVDDSPKGHKQKVRGFGGTVTDATVTVLNALPGDARSRLLRDLLTGDGDEGASFAFLRHSIGASDLSAPPAFTYDDNDNKTDTGLEGFELSDRGNAMADVLAEMRKIRPDVTILGSPWSAPGWMKKNHALIKGDADTNSLDPKYAEPFANLFVRYLQAYAKRGAKVDAITIQNEPLNSQSGGHMTMLMEQEQAASLTRDSVGPALKKAAGQDGVGDVEIWAYDHNTDKPEYPQAVLDAAGKEVVQAAAWHCYQSGGANWTVVSAFHDRNPGVANHMTECWTSPLTSWYQSSQNTIGPLQNWVEASGMWTLGTWAGQETTGDDGTKTTTFGPYLPGGCDTCRGLFTVDKAKGTYELQLDYYVLAQISRFVPVGATVLAGEGSHSYDGYKGVQSVASLNPDGSRSVVIENTFGNDVWVHVRFGAADDGELWSGNALANSVTTWVLP